MVVSLGAQSRTFALSLVICKHTMHQAADMNTRAASPWLAIVASLSKSDDGEQLVTLLPHRPRSLRAVATTRAVVATSQPLHPGDQVLVTTATGCELPLVIGVVDARPQLQLADGASARVNGDTLELRDATGALLLRYAAGTLVLEAQADLELVAAGSVRLRGGDRSELCVEPGAVRVNTTNVEVNATNTRLSSVETTLETDRATTVATKITQRADHIHREASRLVDKSHDMMIEVTELLHTRAGRVRQLVQDVYSLYSRRNVQISSDDTSIDGKRILLG